jgi:hypothetical protein
MIRGVRTNVRGIAGALIRFEVVREHHMAAISSPTEPNGVPQHESDDRASGDQ